MLFRNYRFKNYNIPLVICVITLTIIGIMVIGSANEAVQNRQIIGMVLGVIVMAFVSLVDYEFLLQFHWVSYGLAIVLLAAVLLFGDNTLGATRWLDFGIRFQPSEISKIFLVVFFAWFLTRYADDLNKPRTILFMFVLMAVPLVLIMREPDLSTTIVTFLVMFTMIFLAGLSWKVVLPLVLITIPSAVIYIIIVIQTGTTPFLKRYQSLRILGWLRPDDYPGSSYQQQNSIMAIGSGQLIGKGLNNNSIDSVKNGNYISEPQTDFIFAVAGEELGFVGCVVIIGLLFAIVFLCFRTAKRAKNLAGELICVGIASIIGFQSFVNICVVTGLMPNTGLTLPFVSYGLTSLVTLYIGIGLVLNVGLQANKRGYFT